MSYWGRLSDPLPTAGRLPPFPSWEGGWGDNPLQRGGVYLTQDQDSDGGRLPPGIILIRPLATRSIFSLIPTHKSTLWDTNSGS